MTDILLDFLHHDLFRSLGVAALVAYPDIAQWYLPIVYPASPSDHLQRPEIEAGIELDSYTTMVTVTRTATILSPRLWPATRAPTTHSAVLQTETDLITDTVTKTMLNTIYETLTDTVTATITSHGVMNCATELSSISYVAAPPRSTSSHEWCDEINNLDEANPCSLRPTPIPTESDLKTEDGLDFTEMLLVLCFVIIVILCYVIKRRGAQPWMLERQQEIENLKQRLTVTSEALNTQTETNRSLESRLTFETQQHCEQSEGWGYVLERVERIFTTLTTMKTTILYEPGDAFRKACRDARTAKDHQTNLLNRSEKHIAGFRGEIQRLWLVIKERNRDIQRIKLHDGRGDMKDFQTSIDVKDNALRQAKALHKREIGDMMTELKDLRQKRDHDKAVWDEDQHRRDGDVERLKDQHRRDQEDMSTLQCQYKSAVQEAKQKIEAMQAELDPLRVGRASFDGETRRLRAKVATLEADLANEKHNSKVHTAAAPEANIDSTAAPTTQKEVSLPSWNLQGYTPVPSEDAL
ncbi:hypothetical protein NX059_001518 [Plenodomus lindquistii]|nr:hypothetical protein NX059_001518 [Plenodomus lindquistii]